ncbi:MAG: replication initiation protein RepC [Gemmatimonadetes bacterium]|nr:replication initiation protein RepC [Gemmatimonadota bacterium]
MQPITITNESEIEIPVAADASTAPPRQLSQQSAARLGPERGDCSRRAGKPPPEWLLLESLSPSIARHLPADRPVRLADLHEPITGARSQLGVSDKAWERACVAMTPAGAVLAMIVTASRHDAGELDKPAPAYLNGMSKAAEDGELNLALSLWGVIDRFERSSAAYQATCPSAPSPAASAPTKTFPAARIRQASPAMPTTGARAESTYPSGFPQSETDMTADRQSTPEQVLPDLETLRSLLAAIQFMTISQPVLVPAGWQDLATAAERLASELDTLLRHKEPTLHALRAQAEKTVGTEAASAAVVITAAAYALDLLRKPVVQSFQDMISATAQGSLRLRQRADVVLQALAAESSPSKALAPQLPLPSLESIHSVIQDVDRYWHPSLASTGWPAVIGVARWRVARELQLSDEAWKEACRRMGRHGAAVAVLVVAARYYLAAISNPDESLRGMSRRAMTGKLHLNRALRDVLSQLEIVRNPAPSPNPAVSLPSLDDLHTLCRAERQITRGILLDDKHVRSLPAYLDHLHPSWLLLIHDARDEACAQHYLFEPEWRDGCAAIGEHAAAAVWCLASHRHMAAGEGGYDFHIDFFRGSLRMAAAGALDLPRAVEMEVRAVRGDPLDELDLLQPGPHADQALELLPDSVCAPPDKVLTHPWGWDAIAQEIPELAKGIGISPDTWHRFCEAFGKRQAAGAVLYAMPMRGLAAFPDPEANLLVELEDHLDWDYIHEEHRHPLSIRSSAHDLEREIDRVLVNAAIAAPPGAAINPTLLPPLDELLKAADPRIRSRLAYHPDGDIDLDRYLRAARSACVDELGVPTELWARAMHVLGPHGAAAAGTLIAIYDDYYVPGNPLLPGQAPTETAENALLDCIRTEVHSPGSLRRELVDEHLSPAASLRDDTDPDVLRALEDQALRAPPGDSLLHKLPTLDELSKVAPPDLRSAMARTRDGTPDWRRLLAALDPVRRSVLKIPDRSWAQALHILLEPGTAALATFLAAAAHHQSRDPERFWKFDDDEIDLEFHFCIQRELEEPGFLTGEIRELYYEVKHSE